MKQPRKFAAFDIDWTLHRSALGTDLLLALSRAGFITDSLEQKYNEWQIAEDKAAYFTQHFRELYHPPNLTTLTRPQFEEIGRQLATETERTIITQLRERVEFHRAAGAFLIAITRSPAVVALPLAQILKFDTCTAAPDCLYDEAERYIGPGPREENEKNKGEILSELVEAHGLTWQDSTAYGDSADDIPMLECVQYPVAVNPTPPLRQLASKRGWKIIDTLEQA